LPKGVLAAQLIHAAGSSSDRHPDGTYVVALAVEDELQLYALADKLTEHEIAHALVVEADAPYEGQAMALGIEPVEDRTAVRKVVSSLPLIS
jgi:hypothetical protein